MKPGNLYVNEKGTVVQVDISVLTDAEAATLKPFAGAVEIPEAIVEAKAAKTVKAKAEAKVEIPEAEAEAEAEAAVETALSNDSILD